MKEYKFQFTIVIRRRLSNDLQRSKTLQVEKQVDSDQGSKLTHFGAYLPLVVSLLHLINLILEKLS